MKHMKKNDGYVLVYVMIVFVILSFVAVSICTMALKNLQSQQASIARMQARYEAEGYLQQFVAEVESLSAEGSGGPLLDSADAQAASEDAMKASFLGKVEALENAQLVVTDESVPEKLTIQAVSTDNAVQIDAVLKIDLTSTFEEHQSGEEPSLQYSYVCKLGKVSVLAYEAYDISYQTAEPAGGEGGAE